MRLTNDQEVFFCFTGLDEVKDGCFACLRHRGTLHSDGKPSVAAFENQACGALSDDDGAVSQPQLLEGDEGDLWGEQPAGKLAGQAQ